MKRVMPLTAIDTDVADDDTPVPPGSHAAGQSPMTRSTSFKDRDRDGVIDSADRRSAYQFIRSQTFKTKASSVMLDALHDQGIAKDPKTNEELDLFDQERAKFTWHHNGAGIPAKISIPFCGELVAPRSVVLLSRWNGTFWPATLRSKTIWTTAGIFIALWIVHPSKDDDDMLWSAEHNGNLQALLGLINWPLTTSLIWIVNAAYTYFDQHFTWNATARGRFNSITHMARACFGKESADRLERYCNASHILSYIAVSSAYSYANFAEINEKEYELLTASEIQFLEEQFGPPKPAIFETQRHRERWEALTWNQSGPYQQVVFWAFQVVELETSRKRHVSVDTPMEKAIVDNLVSFSAHLGNTPNKPVPFFFVHMVFFISSVYLPMLSFQLAVEYGSENIMATLAFCCLMLYSSFIVGLRSLARQYADPYGHQVLDLPVLSYWRSLVARAKIPTGPFPGYAAIASLEATSAQNERTCTKSAKSQ